MINKIHSKYFSEEVSKGVDDYLKKLNFYNKLKNKALTLKDIKQLLFQTIEDYKNNSRSLNFLLILSQTLFDETLTINELTDDDLETVYCGLSDILYGLIPENKIEKIIDSAYNALKSSLNLNNR
ncbi:MAG: hypothetical protein ACP5IC_01985 [Minisyncoccia bacterium]